MDQKLTGINISRLGSRCLLRFGMTGPSYHRTKPTPSPTFSEGIWSVLEP